MRRMVEVRTVIFGCHLGVALLFPHGFAIFVLYLIRWQVSFYLWSPRHTGTLRRLLS